MEGVLILCIVTVLAKTCLEKFTPKVYVGCMSYNLLPVIILIHHISQTIRCTGIEKHF